MKKYFVYIMTGNSNVLYTGVTNDLERRVYEHRQGRLSGFTSRYKLHRLVYFEESADVKAAIAREKEIKGWTRKRKADLINTINPGWTDLGRGWGKRKKFCAVGVLRPGILGTTNTVRGQFARGSFAPLRMTYGAMRRGCLGPAHPSIHVRQPSMPVHRQHLAV